MPGRWEVARVGLHTKVVKCPECKAFIERGEDQTTHMEAHFPPEPEDLELEYDYAPGVRIRRDPSLLAELRRELRNIIRIKPAREEVTYSAEQVPELEHFETRAEEFRTRMQRINGTQEGSNGQGKSGL